MAKKVKVSQLDEATSLAGLWILGVDATNSSVKAPMTLLKGLDGKSVELQRTATAIQWRREGGTWVNLMTVADIQKPASDAAASLNTFIEQVAAALNDLQADTEAAKEGATAAASAAVSAASEANTAKEGAVTAATSANEAAGNASGAAEQATVAALEANEARESAATATEQAAEATGVAIAAASAASDAAGTAMAAAETAETVSNNQPRIIDGFWWVYDLSSGNYINTNQPARGESGKPLIVLPNGNYGNWNEETGEYDDSGIEASATVDLENVPVLFTEAEEKDLPETGDTVPTVFGKIVKWFSSLGALAFKSKVDYATDIDNRPIIPPAQVQANWTETDSEQKSYIYNKPELFDGEFGSLAGTPDTLAGYGITDAYTKEDVNSKISAVYRFKGSVDTYEDLPAAGNTVGDVYNILTGTEAGHNFAWSGVSDNHPDGWDMLSGDVDLSVYDTAAVADTKYSGKPVNKTAVLLPDGWIENEGVCAYSVQDNDILEGSFLEAWPIDKESKEIASRIEIYENIVVLDGVFIITAEQKPSKTINITYTVIR